MGQRRGSYRPLVGKPEGKTPPRRSQPRPEEKENLGGWGGGLIWLRIEESGGLL